MMTPEHAFQYIQQKIKRSWLISAGAVFLFGLLAHAFVFLNYLPNWDGLNNFYSSQNTIHLGRSFLTLACGISSYYDLPWVNGLLSLIYLSITAVFICELLEIRRTSTRVLLSGLLAAFPAVTSTFAYMYTADGYFLAMLCMTAGIFLTLKKKHGFLPGALLLAFAFGCYQAYITFAVLLVLVYAIWQLLYRDKPVKELLKHLLHCLFCGVSGLLLYAVLNRILLSLEHTALADYQGISALGQISLRALPGVIRQCLIDFAYFFIGPLSHMNLYSWLNILMLLLLASGILARLVRIKLWQKPGCLALAVLTLILLPFGCFAVYFASPDVSYHMLMHGGLYFIYVLALLPYDNAETEGKMPLHGQLYRWGSLIVSGLMIYNFILIANICYQQQNLTIQASMNRFERVADMAFALPELSDAEQIAVVGTEPESSVSLLLPPDMTGFTDGYIMTNTLHYRNLFNDYYFLSLEAVDEETIVRLGSLPEVQTMPVFPSEGSITVIDRTLIVKLSESTP